MGKYGPRGNPMAAFEKFVAKNLDGCDIWNGATAGAKRTGHGSFWFEGRMQKAHRVAWRLYCGDIPDGMCVCHRCDVPLCVNPAHLFLGTQQENIADMVNKGRQQRVPRPGAKNTQAKITERDVREIRAQFAAGQPVNTICATYRLSETQVRRIGHRQRWASVE